MTGHTVKRCYKKHGFPPGWIQGYKSKNKQQTAAAIMNNTDLGITHEQLHKLISVLQNSSAQSSGSSPQPSGSSPNLTAATTLTPNFRELHTNVNLPTGQCIAVQHIGEASV
ncbi:PREDICTED: uncharacterized protein LOC109147753 [Ipomoea nil]|uniref:uncharacterized protein LOC109147753 n=1 Tax=Ipomoea nil TaxID=35883 RepID=UPI0009011367|nr:PREDICTED: uncharacterized protein LOC109147753 [Ipomoea nil]